jgi:mRNA interferase MazF
MRRGDVYWVELDPARGSEASKVRPAVIVSNDGANRAAEKSRHRVVTVVPITSNTARVHAFQVLLPAGAAGLRKESKAQAEQVRSIAAVRLHSRAGTLAADLLQRLDRALRMHLAL